MDRADRPSETEIKQQRVRFHAKRVVKALERQLETLDGTGIDSETIDTAVLSLAINRMLKRHDRAATATWLLSIATVLMGQDGDKRQGPLN